MAVDKDVGINEGGHGYKGPHVSSRARFRGVWVGVRREDGSLKKKDAAAALEVGGAAFSARAGKHVISAVPAGMSVEELELLLETVKKTGMKYMMAETSYYRR
jgi:hypothetical protein